VARLTIKINFLIFLISVVFGLAEFFLLKLRVHIELVVVFEDYLFNIVKS
jgi:hypothetical protein